jgi:hypothetical protein
MGESVFRELVWKGVKNPGGLLDKLVFGAGVGADASVIASSGLSGPVRNPAALARPGNPRQAQNDTRTKHKVLLVKSRLDKWPHAESSASRMSIEFVGRRRELAVLEQAWKSEGGAFIPIHGRRRVGKSELLVKFMTGKPALYVTGKIVPAELQFREFLRAAAGALDEPLLADHPVADWPAAFRTLRPGRRPRRFRGGRVLGQGNAD